MMLIDGLPVKILRCCNEDIIEMITIESIVCSKKKPLHFTLILI